MQKFYSDRFLNLINFSNFGQKQKLAHFFIFENYTFHEHYIYHEYDVYGVQVKTHRNHNNSKFQRAYISMHVKKKYEGK